VNRRCLAGQDTAHSNTLELIKNSNFLDTIMASQTTQSILRNGLTSPARAMMKQPAARSILKRPAALPMSPRVQVASFSVLLSPTTAQAMKSPHVHFPSPSQMAATITTYSPTSYDRGPISVSPNPLVLPGWGERVYSPSIEGFKLTAPPKVFRSLSMAYQPSPVITDFADPRSPKLQPAADITGSKAIRFAKQGPTMPSTSRNLDHSLSSYPRSPYPSAPVSPSEADVEMETRGRRSVRTRTPDANVSGSARAQARARSLEQRSMSKRNKKGLTLGGRVSTATSFTPIPSPLAQSFLSPAAATSSLNRPNKPAPLALALDADSAGSDQLSNAFWNSVTMAETNSANSAVDQPMVTALEYPESAIEYEEKIDIEIRSASQPPLMFAGADGVLFSPGLPKPRAAIDKIRASLSQALMSPGVKRTTSFARKDITAPSPNDPFAAFPSFGAALGGVGLQYPAPVVQRV